MEETQKELIVIIMAGGLGKRMNSDIPKVLHKVGDIPMLVRVVKQAEQLKPQKIFIVVGKYKEIIENTISDYIQLDNIEFIMQEEALGTAHAIMCCYDELLKYKNENTNTNVLILSGDVPLIRSKTMIELLSNMNKVKLMVTNLNDPTGYGRIIENDDIFNKIVEEKDCNEMEKLINKVNCGIYAFDISILCEYLPHITNENLQNEFYLTDIIEIIKKNTQINIDLYIIPQNKQNEIMGVNNLEQLLQIEDFVH